MRINITVVDKNEKYEKVKLVIPNMIYNRFDIKYSGDFDVLKINYKKKEQYISYHINEKKALYLGIYMMELEQPVFDKIIKFLKKKYPYISHIHITQGLIKNPELENKMHWLLKLPNSVEEWHSWFKSKKRSELRRKLKRLQENHDVEFIHYEKSKIDEDLIKRFLELKKETEKKIYYNTEETGIKVLLSNIYNITDAYIIKIDGKIEAIRLLSVIENGDAYGINVTYNTDYYKFGIGIMVYYYAIEELIKRKIKRLYLGGGNYNYKHECNAIKSETMSGNIRHFNIKRNKLLKIIFECKNEDNHIIVKILGIKFKFKRKPPKRIFANILGKITGCYNYGKNNKVIFIQNGKEYKRFFMPKGLTIYLEKNNGIVKIEEPIKFKNALIDLEGNNAFFSIKHTKHKVKDAKFHMEYNSQIKIGANCQLGNGNLVMIANCSYKTIATIDIGENVYIARNALIRTSDGHTIIDKITNEAINQTQNVVINNNVWICSNCTILKGSFIPKDCIIGACSLVNKKFEEENCIIAGTPAKIIRRNITWDTRGYGKYQSEK